MDPGNWATDLAGGSSFGYMLLFVILLSNLMAVVLQGLAVKLGVVSGLGKSSLLSLVEDRPLCVVHGTKKGRDILLRTTRKDKSWS